MLGLFGTLNLANRSLQTQRQGTEVAGHNLANVNNPSYARQRVVMRTSLSVPGSIGIMGTGADVVAIQRVRDELTDLQVQRESSVRGSLQSQQEVLQFIQASLGQSIDRQATGAEGSAAASGIGGQHGLAEMISDFFNAWQSLSANPTSLTERQVLLMKSQNLSDQFNSVDRRLEELVHSTDEKLKQNVNEANLILSNIAKLNQQIARLEVGSQGFANDLRDSRQEQIEKLSEIVRVETVEDTAGAIEVIVDGSTLVSGPNTLDQLEMFDPGDGKPRVRTASGGTPLNITGGSMHGLISVRDGELNELQNDIDRLAGAMINEVNRIHAAGFNLQNETGESFFAGNEAGTIRINPALLDDPGKLQASGEPGSPGNNQTALAIAKLNQARFPALNQQTFSENYSQNVAKLGQYLASTNTQLTDQSVVERMLLRQRDSVSGVSLDEEMTDLIKFQRAFEASAKMVGTIDEMLATLINLKR